MKKSLFALLFFMAPLFVFADEVKDVWGLITFVRNGINALVPLVIGAAVLYFLWGVFGYTTSGGDKTKRAEAIKVITWGIVGIFVMVSVYGLVNILTNTFFGKDGFSEGRGVVRDIDQDQAKLRDLDCVNNVC